MVECGNFFIDGGIGGFFSSVVKHGRCDAKSTKLTFKNN